MRNTAQKQHINYIKIIVAYAIDIDLKKRYNLIVKTRLYRFFCIFRSRFFMEDLFFRNDQSMIDYVDTLSEFRLPRWDKIPTLGLYMDQVVTVIDQALSPLIGFNEEAFITPAMINNYVKLGMVRKPDKKKYSREHIASLIVITVLKQSTAIGDIRLGIDTALKNSDPQSSYDSFCDYVERAVRIVALSTVCKDDTATMDFSFHSQHALITMAVCSFATKIITAKMVSILRESTLYSDTEQK